MTEYKEFMIILIAISIIIQIGNILLSKTGYYTIFKAASGIIFIVTTIIYLASCKNDISIITDNNKYIRTHYDNIDIKESFEKNLEKTITDDLHNKFYVNINIDVKTDFKKLEIYVQDSMEEDIANKVKAYLKNEYCTSDDEVILVNEFE